MSTKDTDYIADPWEIWPDGIIPAEGNRPECRLLTEEEGKAWLKELDERRKALGIRMPDSYSSLDTIRQERDES